MNCSALCTAPLSSRYFSLRNWCDLASPAVCQVPLRLNSQPETSSLDSRPSISALAAAERGAAIPAGMRKKVNRVSRRRRMTEPMLATEKSATLEQPIDRKNRQHVDAPAPKPARSGFGVVTRFARSGLLDPLQTAAVGPEADLVCRRGDGRVEGLGEPLCERRAVDHEAHRSVQRRRALVEVDRTDEDPAAIDGESLRVQGC